MTLAVARRVAGSPTDSITNTRPDGELAAVAFEAPLGWTAIAARGEVLLGTTFGHASQSRAERALGQILNREGRRIKFASEHEIDDRSATAVDWMERLRRYVAGEPVGFSDVRIDESHLTQFGRRVIEACRRIVWGQVRTYGELAAECGSPGAARAVGQVMARNRFPLVVPCHRVVGAGGTLGGFSAPEGLRMKRRLLAMERRSLAGPSLLLDQPNIRPTSRK